MPWHSTRGFESRRGPLMTTPAYSGTEFYLQTDWRNNLVHEGEVEYGWDDVGSWEAASRLTRTTVADAKSQLLLESPESAVFGDRLREPAVLGWVDLVQPARGHRDRSAPGVQRRLVRDAVNAPRQAAHHGHAAARQVAQRLARMSPEEQAAEGLYAEQKADQDRHDDRQQKQQADLPPGKSISLRLATIQEQDQHATDGQQPKRQQQPNVPIQVCRNARGQHRTIQLPHQAQRKGRLGRVRTDAIEGNI